MKKLKDEGVEIHSALEGALEKIYGYTNDAEGTPLPCWTNPPSTHADALLHARVEFGACELLEVEIKHG